MIFNKVFKLMHVCNDVLLGKVRVHILRIYILGTVSFNLLAKAKLSKLSKYHLILPSSRFLYQDGSGPKRLQRSGMLQK